MSDMIQSSPVLSLKQNSRSSKKTQKRPFEKEQLGRLTLVFNLPVVDSLIEHLGN